MKITANQLKEIIRQAIKEIDFKNQAAFDAYNKKHKMRKSTKVKVAGKDTTAGDAEKKDTDKKGDEQIFNVFVDDHDKPMKIKASDEKSARHQAYQKIQNPNVKITAEPAGVGGPSHANVPTKKKKEKMVRNAAGDMVPANTVAGHPDFKKDDKPHPGERDPSVRASREKPSDDSGGPSYANVPKGAKSTKQANLMKKNDSIAKELGFKNTDDVFSASASDIDDYIENISDEGQDFDQALELMNLVRDNEQGVRDDDQDVIDDYLNKVKKIINTPGEKGGSGKSGKDIEKQTMKAADDANTKMDKAELKQHYAKAKKMKKELSALVDKGDKKGMKKKEAEIKKFWADTIDPLEKKVYGESVIVREFKQRRYTIKEVRMWMKKLEENRYKKVYNSDCRRVAWMVNHIGENLENMPTSMRKKWTKAQYGRERYLANEFIKSQKTKMNEIKFRNTIRQLILNK